MPHAYLFPNWLPYAHIRQDKSELTEDQLMLDQNLTNIWRRSTNKRLIGSHSYIKSRGNCINEPTIGPNKVPELQLPTISVSWQEQRSHHLERWLSRPFSLPRGGTVDNHPGLLATVTHSISTVLKIFHHKSSIKPKSINLLCILVLLCTLVCLSISILTNYLANSGIHFGCQPVPTWQTLFAVLLEI